MASLNHQLKVIILQVRGEMRPQVGVVPVPARRIAANVAKLPELLRKVAAFPNYLFSIDLDQSEISEPCLHCTKARADQALKLVCVALPSGH